METVYLYPGGAVNMIHPLATMRMHHDDRRDTEQALNDYSSPPNQTYFLLHTGMVNIDSPESTVCYESTPNLTCTFEEWTEHAVWSMSSQNQRFELNTGIVVELISNCANEKYKSCTGVILKKVTEIWSGKFKKSN